MGSLICPRETICRRLVTPCNASITNRKHSSMQSFISTTSTTTRSARPQASSARISLVISRSNFPRPAILTSKPTPSGRRAASSSASASSPSSSSSAVDGDVLTWDRFFDLRRKRRYVNLGSSILTAVATVGVFGPIIAQQDIDVWASQISGLAPEIVLGITTFAVGAGGWLCGPSFGSAGFRIWAARKGWAKGIVEKERSFYARIKRYRADPANSSPQNPVPDYYGEKISSVKDYRRWLKDQRAFNRKREKNII